MEISASGRALNVSAEFSCVPRNPSIPYPRLSSIDAASAGAITRRNRFGGPSVVAWPRSPTRSRILTATEFAQVGDAGDQCTQEHHRKPLRVRLPLKVVMVLALTIFTVAPSVTLWFLSWRTGLGEFNEMQSVGGQSTEVMLHLSPSISFVFMFPVTTCSQELSLELRSYIINKASSSLNKLIESTESAMRDALLRLSTDLQFASRKQYASFGNKSGSTNPSDPSASLEFGFPKYIENAAFIVNQSQYRD